MDLDQKHWNWGTNYKITGRVRYSWFLCVKLNKGLFLSALWMIFSYVQGIVDIYTTFNLKMVKRVRNAHSTFITGTVPTPRVAEKWAVWFVTFFTPSIKSTHRKYLVRKMLRFRFLWIFGNFIVLSWCKPKLLKLNYFIGCRFFLFHYFGRTT